MNRPPDRESHPQPRSQRTRGAETHQGAGAGTGALVTSGVQFTVTILLFLFLGQWLDKRWGTTPWLTIAGAFLGAGGGFVSLYRTLMDAQKREEDERR